MSKFLAPLALAAVAALGASPAAAVTFILGGPTANVASVSRSAEGIGLTITAKKFTPAPGTLTHLSQLTGTGQVSVTAPGLGVNGGGSSPQIDTNTASAREALLVVSTKALAITGLKLSYVDANDTLQIYGVNADGSLVSFGYGGTIAAGLAGGAGYLNSSANSGTTRLTLNNATQYFDRFLFTTRVGGDVKFGGDLGQGYRLDSISAAVVPEPASWALLISGFGLVGVAVRRQRGFAAA